ncbi:MAG: beta-galactosidase [Candidatus Hydrogenedentes bacterium]|nr:beta-galactosidase [Candidatus Hydrogenedentota bacterium]
MLTGTSQSEERYVDEYLVSEFDVDSGFAPDAGGQLADRAWSADLTTTEVTALNHSLSLLGTPQELVLSVRSNVAGPVLRLHLGSHFQVFGRTLGRLNGKEQVLRVPAPPEGWGYWDGENDGKVMLPLRVLKIMLHRGDAPPGRVEVELRSLRCVSEFRPEQVVALLAETRSTAEEPSGRTLETTYTAWNFLNKDLAGTLGITIRDWEEHIVHQESRPWTLPAQDVPCHASYTATVPSALNFAELEFTFTSGEYGPFVAKTSYTRSLDNPGDPALRPESPWGMGLYCYRYPDTSEGHALMDRAATLAQAAGVKWTREEFSWQRIEPRRGEYDFGFYDVVVDTARRHGISVYGLLAYWTDWTQAYTEAGIDDFCHWTRAVVGHFKDRVKHWEVYNEPNIFFWSGPKELYPVLLQRAYAAIKETDPEAQVLGVSCAGVDREFIGRCASVAPFDILTVHPYRRELVEDVFIADLKAAAGIAGGRPVWITELGWSTQYGGNDERTQAQILARCYLISAASEVCRSFSWYDLRNDGTDRFYNEYNFGVLRRDYIPKPAYRALATVCRTLDQGEPQRVSGFGESVYGLRMGEALALWSPRAIRVTCKVESGNVRVVNLMSEELEVDLKDGTLQLELRPNSPVFITGAKLGP